MKMLALVLALSGTTLAHSWYPRNCCSDKDCRPVACDELIELNDGSVKWNQFVFARDTVRPSQDKLCHVCVVTLTGGNPQIKQPRCVFIQQGV